MFTAAEKREAVQREITLRKRVYPRRVEAGHMTQSGADYQIKIFEAIRDDYAKMEAGERLI